MDTEGRAALRRRLHARREAIAGEWRRALARTAFSPADSAAVAGELARLADEAGELLVAEALIPERAQDLGAAVVALGYAAPEALRGTLQTLGRELIADLPADQLAALHPRLTALLREVAVGFCATQRDTILADQEAERRGQLTERRRVEAALRASEAQLRAVVGGLPIALLALDCQGVVTLADGTGLAALGLTREEAVGRSAFELFATVPILVQNLRHALAGEERTVVVTLGALVIEVRHTPLHGEGGAIVGALGVALDITAHQRAEERLRAILRHAPIVLFALDRHGTVTLSAGRGLAALHRRPGDAPVGRSIFEVYRDAPTVLDHARRALGGEAFTARAVVGDATYETYYLPLRAANGTPTGVLGVGTDISARARAERALRRREARLSATEEALLPLLVRTDLRTYREVGAPLGLGPERVRDFVRSIAGKLNVASERDAVIATIRERELL